MDRGTKPAVCANEFHVLALAERAQGKTAGQQAGAELFQGLELRILR